MLFAFERQIIHRCCAEIDLGAIFDGDIDAAMTVLNESRACGVEWKVCFEHPVQSCASRVVAHTTPRLLCKALTLM